MSIVSSLVGTPRSITATGEQAFLNQNNQRISVGLETTGAPDGKLMRLWCQVWCPTIAAAGTGTFGLRFNSKLNPDATTFTSDTALTSIGAFTLASVGALCSLCLEFVWDSVSQKVIGSYLAITATAAGTAGTLTNWSVMTSLTGITSATSISFFPTINFSAGVNQANLIDLYLEQP